MIRKFNFQKRWKADVDWTAGDCEHEIPVGPDEDPDAELCNVLGMMGDARVRRRRAQAASRYQSKTADFTSVGAHLGQGVQIQREQGWVSFQAALVQHFTAMHARHAVVY
eukprot:2336859-Rhodomonas_salina.1